MRILPDDIQFLNQLAKISSWIPTDTFEQDLESKISEAENTPLYSALPEWTLRVPGLSSPSKLFSWYLGLLLVLPNWDILKHEALIKVLDEGIRRWEPGNKYEIFKEFSFYFCSEEKIKTRSPYNFAEVLEFLLLHLSRDSVFGNIVPQVGKYLEAPSTFYRLSRKRWPRARRPQRKRGYNDKGSLPDDFPIERPLKEVSANSLTRKFLRERIKNELFPEEFLWLAHPSKMRGGGS